MNISGFRWHGLGPRIFLTTLLVFVLVLVGSFLVFRVTIENVNRELGGRLAQQQAVTIRSQMMEALSREVALARQMAASPLLRQWAAKEEDHRLHRDGLAELESYRQRFSSHSWFYAVERSLHYYYNDKDGSYSGKEIAYTLDRQAQKDAWYFATLNDVKDYALNVDYDITVGVFNLWINVPIRTPEGKPLGVAGTGLDMSNFIQHYIDHPKKGIENILIDRELAIQAHRDKSLIDRQSIRKRQDHSTLLQWLSPGEANELKSALGRLDAQESESIAMMLNIEGKQRLVGVAAMPELKFYVLTVLDIDQVMEDYSFTAIFLAFVGALLALAVALWVAVDRLVIRRLRQLVSATIRMQRGEQVNPLQSGGKDELGELMQSFDQMSAAIQKNTAELEHRVQGRTLALAQSEEKLRSLFELSPLGIALTDMSGKYIEFNQAFEKITGYPLDELNKLDYWALTPKKYTDDEMKQLESLRTTGHYGPYEKEYIRKDGSPIPILLNGVQMSGRDGKEYIWSIVEDITVRKQSERTLQRKLVFSHAINRISDVIAKINDSNQILDQTSQIVGEALGADRSLIYEISFGKNQAVALCEWLNPQCIGITSTKGTYPLDVFIGGATEVARTKHWIASFDDDINPCLLADGSGEILHHSMMIKSLLWFPFSFSEDEFYLLAINQIMSGKKWATDELDFLESVSHSLSVALEKIALLSERDKVESDLRISAIAFDTQEGILISDRNNVILRVNRAFTDITGYSAEEVVGKDPSILSSGLQDAGFYAAMWQSINDSGSWAGEVWNRRKNGEVYPEHLVVTAVTDRKGVVTHYVASLADITQRKASEDKIQQLAFYDPLTRLPNRRLLLDRLQQTLLNSSRNSKTGALLFIDLDNFKALNDTKGHDIGDMLLQQVALRLKSCVREGDTVARLGGDEFVLVLEDLSEQLSEAATQAEFVGEKILDALNKSYRLGNHDHLSTPSIGATLFKGSQVDMDELMKQADIAMYQAKKSGRNTMRFFDPAMQAAVTAHVVLESELRHAISVQEQLHLLYQIQVDAAGAAIGAEALVRWEHPERGMISPAQFIPLAEESGLILLLGHWVLATACKQLADWAKRPETAQLTMAVNISAKQFGLSTFVEEVLALIEYFGVEPTRLKLEVTEGMLLNNLEEIVVKMTALKARGINFSMDDFGTGYSSLQYLKRLPLDQLKIDQSFVRDIVDDGNDRALVKTIIAMAYSLDLDVIAEGVETEAQRKILLKKGCNCFQGYLFGRPQPAEEFESSLKLLDATGEAVK